MKLFQWTGFCPRDMRDEIPADRRHVIQVSCAAAFPSVAAFLRAIDSKRSRMPYIAVSDVRGDGDYGNEGARLAVADPGTVYWKDDLTHPRRDAPWFVHTDPRGS